MSIFKRIREIVRPSAPALTETEFPLPYGLKASEWARLKTLPTEEAFKIYTGVLDELTKLKGESILQSSSTETLHYLRGFVAGLRKAGLVVNEIEIAERNHARARTDARSDSDSRTRDRGEFFGTSYFRR